MIRIFGYHPASSSYDFGYHPGAQLRPITKKGFQKIWLPSSKRLHNYGTSPYRNLVDFPIDSMVIFQFAMLVITKGYPKCLVAPLVEHP